MGARSSTSNSNTNQANGLTQSASFTITYGVNYSASAAFQFGKLQRISPMTIDGLSLGNACGADVSTAAVIPWLLTTTNTTPNFSAQIPQPSLNIGTSGDRTGNMSIEIMFAGSSQCTDRGDSASAGFIPSSRPQDQPDKIAGYIIADNFFNPNSSNAPPDNANGIDIGIGSNSEGAQMTLGPGFNQQGYIHFPA
jgi:hypothetical protein